MKKAMKVGILGVVMSSLPGLVPSAHAWSESWTCNEEGKQVLEVSLWNYNTRVDLESGASVKLFETGEILYGKYSWNVIPSGSRLAGFKELNVWVRDSGASDDAGKMAGQSQVSLVVSTSFRGDVKGTAFGHALIYSKNSEIPHEYLLDCEGQLP